MEDSKTYFGTTTILISIAILLLGVFLIFVLPSWLITQPPFINYKDSGPIGDSIGGLSGPIVGLIAAILTFWAFWAQFKANQQQKTDLQVERFENKFYQMIQIHRDNVSELKMRSIKILEKEDYVFDTLNEDGKAVFKDIFHQFVDCANELKLFFSKLDRIYEDSYRIKCERSKIIGNDKKNLALLAKIDICYSIVYYGVDAEGLITLHKIFEGKYKTKFIQDILRYISLKPCDDLPILKKWAKINKRGTRVTKLAIVEKIFEWRRNNRLLLTEEEEDDDVSIFILAKGYHNRYPKYYGGHQFRLGHYFRHLYQSVKFINNQELINYKEKYQYIKVLRAQLSNYEQAVLFLNSLSSFGHKWELDPEIKIGQFKQDKINFELITKYNLIKNLPGDSIYGIPFKKFYPNVQFEGTSMSRDNSLYR
jgi:hypothetical protein